MKRNRNLSLTVVIAFLSTVCNMAAQESLLKYTPIGTTTASVESTSQDIVGVITVPEKVEIDGKTYTVTDVPKYGFFGCKQLTEVKLPETIISLGSNAFRMSGIQSINIPKATEFIGYYTFHNCESLTSISVSEGNEYFLTIDGVLIDKSHCLRAIPNKFEEYIVPEEITILGEDAFCGSSKLKRLIIPNTIKCVLEETAGGCNNLEEVIWEADYPKIPKCCFASCWALKSFVIPENVREIGEDCFFGCGNLKSITIRHSMPIGITDTTFPEACYENTTLYVPTGSVVSYRKVANWRNFQHIEEMDMPGIEPEKNIYLALEDNQMILGYYNWDLNQSNDDLYGGIGEGTHYAYIGFNKEWMTAFKGNRIRNIRFSLKDTTNVYDMRVFIGSSHHQEDLCSQPVQELKTGWNEVELSSPYLIMGDNIFVGVAYKQHEFGNFPLNWIYGYGGKGSFYKYSMVDSWPNGPEYEFDDYGDEYHYALALQCLVEGDQLPQEEAQVVGMRLNEKYRKQGETLSGIYSIRNIGKKKIENIELQAYINGKEHPITITEGRFPHQSDIVQKDMKFNINLDQPYEIGEKELKVEIKSINGHQPQFAEDDLRQQSFMLYSQAMDRQKVLIDYFTSSGCGNSYWGVEKINRLNTQRSAATIVCYFRGIGNETCEEYIELLISGFPTIFVNRFAYNGDKVLLNMNGNSELEWYDFAVATPAFANVNIGSKYNSDSRQLHVNVFGTRCSDFTNIEKEAFLTVLLTEDSIITEQRWYSTVVPEFRHDNVLRTRLTETWGNPVVWSGDTYNMDFISTIPVDWNPDKMHIVAFLAKPFKGSNFDEMGIINCNDAWVGGNSVVTSIETLQHSEHTVNENIYTMSGQLIGQGTPSHLNLRPGIYLINGQKIVVR